MSVWLLLSTTAFGQDIPDLVKQVEAKYETVQAIQADFEQHTKSSFAPNGITVKGQVVMKRKRKMRWQFDAPDSRLFLSDGAKAYMWNPSAKQYFILDDMSSGANQILDNLSSLDEYFVVDVSEQPKETASRLQLSLTPKVDTQLSTSVKSLEVTLDKAELMLNEIVVHDHMGSITTIQFENVLLNPKVEDTLFQFVPPEGAEIIKSNGI